jgi:hypothetical protein
MSEAQLLTKRLHVELYSMLSNIRDGGSVDDAWEEIMKLHNQELSQAVQAERERCLQIVISVASTAAHSSLEDVREYRKRVIEALTQESK